MSVFKCFGIIGGVVVARCLRYGRRQINH
jgi:hypothetical protein